MVAQKASILKLLGRGDDFRDYKQKMRDKKGEFVHKIKERSGVSKVKCILIFILGGILFPW